MKLTLMLGCLYSI